jgi:hypothetical protein
VQVQDDDKEEGKDNDEGLLAKARDYFTVASPPSTPNT